MTHRFGEGVGEPVAHDALAVSLDHEPPPSSRPLHTLSRMGLGAKPLHGLRSWGHALPATMEGINTRKAIESPATLVGTSLANDRSACIGAFWNKFTW